MKVTSATNIGPRKENQDRVYTTTLPDGSVLAILCDGMGGENAGGFASETAVNIIKKRMIFGYSENFDSNSIRNVLISSVSAANAAVFAASIEDEEKKGMGTTCVIAFVRNGVAHIVNVGDSRAYFITKNVMEQITKDHTVVRFLLDSGEISEEEVKNHPQRNYITRAVGTASVVDIDYFEKNIVDDGKLLLCSDGLSSYCNDDEIFTVVNNGNIEQNAEDLINLALPKTRDNISLALISNL